jgi:hypothetical protein
MPIQPGVQVRIFKVEALSKSYSRRKVSSRSIFVPARRAFQNNQHNVWMIMDTGLTPTQLMPIQPRVQFRIFKVNEPLVTHDFIKQQQTQMYCLHKWYIEVIKQGRSMFVAKIRHEHYFYGEDVINIELKKYAEYSK